MIPPGLLCASCRQPFSAALARRTRKGWVHARACASPDVLEDGHWVNDRGIRRWVPGGRSWHDAETEPEEPWRPATKEETRELQISEAQWLADHGANLTEVLHRLGIKRSTFHQTCRRRDCMDLYWRLAEREVDAYFTKIGRRNGDAA